MATDVGVDSPTGNRSASISIDLIAAQPKIRLDPDKVKAIAKAWASLPDLTCDIAIEGEVDEVEVRENLSICLSKIAAKLGSFSSNSGACHLKRSNADKRRAVLEMLASDLWSSWSDREIAKRCGVHHQMVGKLRASLDESSSERKYKTKHGTTALMKVKNDSRWRKGNLVAIDKNHPYLAGRIGIIFDIEEDFGVIVEFDGGEKELVELRYLKAAIAAHLKLYPGRLVEVRVPNNPAIDGRQGRIASVGSETVDVWLRDIEQMTMRRHRLPIKQVEPVPLESEPKLTEISDRTSRLVEVGLDPFDLEIVSMLERAVVLTPRELEHLERMEERYLVRPDDLSKER